MALIIDTKGRKDPENSGYFRLFAEGSDDVQAFKLATLMTKIHATTIRNGNILDGSILSSPTYNPHAPSKGEVASKSLREGHFTKLKVLQSDCPSIVGKEKIEVDYVAVEPDRITLYEIKDGDAFDTKKSDGEVASLDIIRDHFKSLYPAKNVMRHFVLWNVTVVTPESAKSSIKVNNLEKGAVISGSEFCSKIKIDYDAINLARRMSAKANKDHVKEEFLKIFDD
jgi:hypothetical protein